MEESSTETGKAGQDDLALVLSFAARGQTAGEGDDEGDAAGRLVAAGELAGFTAVALGRLAGAGRKEVLRRALGFAVPLPGETVERSFVILFSALEAALTFSRGEDEFEIVPREEFTRMERDLKNWLRQHPALAGEPARRALVYEKTRELNRLPFSRVFERFCERHGVELSDLWPLTGPLDEWPLLEIRHRLVHGDPLESRPAAALLYAREHLRWTAERMLLALLGWPVEKSNVSPPRLAAVSEAHRRWPEERARLA